MTYHEHISQMFGKCPLLVGQCIFSQCGVSCDELKDFFLEHNMRLEGSKVGIPSCWNSAGECAALGVVRVNESLKLKLKWL